MTDDETDPRRGGQSIRERLEMVNDRSIKTDVRQTEHEKLCTQRYSDILEKVNAIRTELATIAKIGLVLAIMLFGVELGRATFPAIFDAITHVGH
jgi:hypothetical protein